MSPAAAPASSRRAGASSGLLRRFARALLLASLPAAGGAPAEEPPPPRVVALRAVDRLDRPVAGLSACVLPACAPVPVDAADDGFRLALPAPREDGTPARLRLEAPGFAPAELDAPVSAPSGPLLVRLRAKGSVTATFLPLDERREGALVVGLAPVAAKGSLGPGKPFVEKKVTLPRRPGRAKAAFDDVPPGTWALVYGGPGLAAGTKAVVVADGPLEAGAIGLTPGFAVEGAVRDDLGVPVAGARVLLQEVASFERRDSFLEEARTGVDGSFGVAGVPSESPVLWVVRAPGHMETKGRLGGETRLEVVLERAQRVSGRVVDPAGDPVRGAEIAAFYLREGSSRNHGGRIETDDDGAFAFFRETPDLTRVEVRARGFRTSKRELGPLGGTGWPKEASLGELTLDPGRALRGRVLDGATGAPVGGAAVKTNVARKEGKALVLDQQETVADAEGRFELSGLPPDEPATLLARMPGWAPRSLEVSPGTDEVEVLLGRGGRVEGRLCGRPSELARSEIQMEQPGWGDMREGARKPDAAGRFVFTGVEPGRRAFVRAWVYESPLRPGSWAILVGGTRAAVDVVEGRTTTLDLGCEGIPLAGLLLRDGKPLGNKPVVFSGPGDAAPDTMTDAAGRFFTLVPAPGTYEPFTDEVPPAGTRWAPISCNVPPGGLDGCVLDLRAAGAQEAR